MLGRCIGVWLIAVLLSVRLTIAAIVAIDWQLGSLPQPQHAVQPQSWLKSIKRSCQYQLIVPWFG